jgi:hypothetical protein
MRYVLETGAVLLVSTLSDLVFLNEYADAEFLRANGASHWANDEPLTIEQLKDSGNKAFQNGDVQSSLSFHK